MPGSFSIKCPPEIYDMMVDVRRSLHRRPEVAFQEAATAALVAEKLSGFGLDVATQVAGTGVVALLRGEVEGPTGAIRADMDGISITEQTGAEYASEIPGVMHACGHDGHVAMALGAAAILSQMKGQVPGTVKFIFQPGEESGRGAEAMIRAGVLNDPEVDFMLGVHLWPDLSVGKVGIQYGACMASSDILRAVVRGRSAHAAFPHEGVDAILVASALVVNLKLVVATGVEPGEPAVVSVGTISGGYRRNVISDCVALEGTIRACSERVRELVIKRVQRVAKHIAQAYGAECDVTIEPLVPPLVNDEEVTKTVEVCARSLFGDEAVVVLTRVPLTGEDFSRYAERVPAALIKIGCHNPTEGPIRPLHSPLFDFDERAMAVGAELLASSTIHLLKAWRRRGRL